VLNLGYKGCAHMRIIGCDLSHVRHCAFPRIMQSHSKLERAGRAVLSGRSRSEYCPCSRGGEAKSPEESGRTFASQGKPSLRPYLLTRALSVREIRARADASLFLGAERLAPLAAVIRSALSKQRGCRKARVPVNSLELAWDGPMRTAPTGLSPPPPKKAHTRKERGKSLHGHPSRARLDQTETDGAGQWAGPGMSTVPWAARRLPGKSEGVTKPVWGAGPREAALFGPDAEAEDEGRVEID
jgi:hypothetical protein